MKAETAAGYARKSDVVITLTGDAGGTRFAEQFQSSPGSITVTLPSGTTKTVNHKGLQSNTEYYEVSENRITVHDPEGRIFDENGSYTLTLTVSPYNGVVTNSFTVTGALKTPPAWNLTVSKETDADNAAKYYYLLRFGASGSAPGLEDYKNAITAVTVNGTAYSETEIGRTITRCRYDWPVQAQNDVVLRLYGATVFQKSGDNTIVLLASGYETLTLTLNVDGDTLTLDGKPEKPAPAGAPASASAEKQEHSYKVTFSVAEGYDLDAYLRAVKTVTVGDRTYSTAPLTEAGSRVTLGITDSAGSSRYDFFTLPITGIEYGDHTAVIHAEAYADLSFTLSGGEEPARVSPEKAEAALSSDKKSYTLTLTYPGTSEQLAAYIAAVRISEFKITKDGEDDRSLPAAQLSDALNVSGTTLYFAADLAEAYEAVNTVTLRAEGYADVVVTIDNTANKLSEPPAVRKVEMKTYSDSSCYRVSLQNAGTGYVNAITGIQVGAAAYTPMPSNLGSPAAGQYYGGSDFVDLSTSGFPEDQEVSVTIAAAGYRTLTFKVKDGRLVFEGTKQAAPAAVKGVRPGVSSYDGSVSYYYVEFDGAADSAALEAYLKAVDVFTLNHTEYTAAAGSSVSGSEFLPYAYNSATGEKTYDRLRFGSEAFLTGGTDVNTIVISAFGYHDLTAEVRSNGRLYVDPVAGPTAAAAAKQSDGSYALSFTWPAGITGAAKAAYIANAAVRFHDAAVEEAYLTRSGDTITVAGAALQGLAAGSYTFKISAEDYDPETLETAAVEIEASLTPAPEVDAFVAMGSSYPYYRVSFKSLTGDALLAYLNAVTAVTVNAGGEDVSYTKKNESSNNDFGYSDSNKYKIWGGYSYNKTYDLDMLKTSFSKDGNTTVTVRAEGYADLVAVVSSNGNLVIDGVVQRRDAPRISGEICKDSGYFWIDFDETYAGLSAYIAAVDVKGGKAVVAENGETKEVALSAYTGNSCGIKFDATDISAGEVTIVLEAEGWKELTVTFDAGAIKAKVPAYKFEKKYDYSIGGYQYRFSFSKSENGNDLTGVASYFDAITSIEADGTELASGAYEKNTSSSYNYYLTFDKDAVTGSNSTVTVHATGYADVSVSVQNAVTGY